MTFAPARPALTADLVARALVASARAFGDDPVGALTAKPRRGDATRRSVAPAGIVLCEVTGRTHAALNRVLGLAQGTLGEAWRRPGAEKAIAAVRAELAELIGPAEDPRRAVGPPLAPPPVAQEAPPPPPARVDHTPVIRAALQRRKGVAFEVVGIETDALLLPEPGKGGCGFPMGDPRSPDYRACDAEKVAGRRYCARHLKVSGLAADPTEIRTAGGRVAAAYDEDAA
jgi:hypothetical protein